MQKKCARDTDLSVNFVTLLNFYTVILFLITE